MFRLEFALRQGYGSTLRFFTELNSAFLAALTDPKF